MKRPCPFCGDAMAEQALDGSGPGNFISFCPTCDEAEEKRTMEGPAPSENDRDSAAKLLADLQADPEEWAKLTEVANSWASYLKAGMPVETITGDDIRREVDETLQRLREEGDA